MFSRLSLLLSLAALSRAYTTSENNCIIPAAGTNFVFSPDTRGTLDILWSCLFTIIACTWTIQHLNVPEQREGRDPGWLGDIKWKLKRTWSTITWMLITMVAPEIVLGIAWGDLGSVEVEIKALQTFAAEDGVPWTLTHSLFANMGGFVIRTNTSRTRGRPALLGIGTQTESALLVSESNVDSESAQIKKSTSTLSYPNPFHLTASDIHSLRKAGLLARLPHVTVDEINDKSKCDSFTRVIAIFQILWTAVQIIGRAARHLAISQLEIAVLAFSACAIIIYGLNWKKPKGVEVPFTLAQYEGEIPEQTLTILKARPRFAGELFRYKNIGVSEALDIRKTSIKFLLTKFHILGSPIPNDGSASDGWKDILGIALGSVLFGALHIAAWNFIFPSKAEQIVWRTASLICTGFIPIYLLIDVPLAFVMKDPGDIVIILVSILYILARLFLMVEIFRTLCFLPPLAYAATWASNIPHIT